jgi:hypothetical protein
MFSGIADVAEMRTPESPLAGIRSAHDKLMNSSTQFKTFLRPMSPHPEAPGATIKSEQLKHQLSLPHGLAVLLAWSCGRESKGRECRAS